MGPAAQGWWPGLCHWHRQLRALPAPHPTGRTANYSGRSLQPEALWCRGFWSTFGQLPRTLGQSPDENRRMPPGPVRLEPADHLQDQRKCALQGNRGPLPPAPWRSHATPDPRHSSPRGTQAQPREQLLQARGRSHSAAVSGAARRAAPEKPGCADTGAGSAKLGWQWLPECRGCPGQSPLGGAASSEGLLPQTHGRRRPLTPSWAPGTKVHAQRPLQTDKRDLRTPTWP